MNAHEKTVELLKQVAKKYELDNLKEVLEDDDSLLFEKDIFISLKNIVQAAISEGDTKELLKEATNVYNGPIFAINAQNGEFLIKNEPDFKRAIEMLGEYNFSFKLSPYHIVNSYLSLVIAQVTGLDVDELYNKADQHIKEFIDYALENYPNWDKETLTTDDPVLMMPIGAAGSGKSTFYKELSNVVNFSCDNIRYLLFKDYGPCFSPWESGLSWWIVNRLVDHYLEKGYNIFYNGVNTDLEYRSPITMEHDDPLYAGMPYKVKLVYFEPPVELNDEELEELKSINLWETPIEEADTGELSEKVGYIIDFIKANYQRTFTRTEKISSGEESQDPFDILYAVPAPIVKLFVEQSFDKPDADNMVVVKRKEIPDPQERSAFYRKYAEIAMNG
ncbi:MAG: hypothetical protein U9R36_06310 [Elusimicrobiota bacterium]|nr:hypothetical protein [Elusimicrobiota bacterium]